MAPFHPGDIIEFLVGDQDADWTGLPASNNRLAFFPGYQTSDNLGRINQVQEVSGAFLRLTAFSMLWAPMSACRLVSPNSDASLTTLRTLYPHGHPDFIPRMLEILKLHSDKNHDYALGGPPLGNFERTAKIMALYPKFPWATDYGCAVVQMLKQLDAFMWQAQDPVFKPKVEGGDPRLRDVTVFSQLIAIMVQAAAK